MRTLLVILLILVALLQHKAWFSDVGDVSAEALRAQLREEAGRAEVLADRNRRLTAEVLALKRGAEDGFAAVEARARGDLGMIRQGETFYLVPDRPNQGNQLKQPNQFKQR
jgi:cell division protein FtsB